MILIIHLLIMIIKKLEEVEFLYLLNYINNKIKHNKYIKILNNNLNNKIINFNLLMKVE